MLAGRFQALYSQQLNDSIKVQHSAPSSFCLLDVGTPLRLGPFGSIRWQLVVIRALSVLVVWLGQVMQPLYLQISKSQQGIGLN